MDERPWWSYVLEIFGVACLIVGFLFAHMYADTWSTDLSWSVTPLTVSLALMLFGMFATLVSVLRWASGRHGGLWDFFGNWW